jgi:hypothetical protein
MTFWDADEIALHPFFAWISAPSFSFPVGVVVEVERLTWVRKIDLMRALRWYRKRLRRLTVTQVADVHLFVGQQPQFSLLDSLDLALWTELFV